MNALRSWSSPYDEACEPALVQGAPPPLPAAARSEELRRSKLFSRKAAPSYDSSSCAPRRRESRERKKKRIRAWGVFSECCSPGFRKIAHKARQLEAKRGPATLPFEELLSFL